MKSVDERKHEWLFFAQEDLRGAEEMLNKEIFHLACFLAHQRVEKTLKVFLVTAEVTPPKIHNLLELYKKIIKDYPEFVEFKEGTEWMNQFYIPTRYPETLVGSLPEGLPTKEDAQKAVEIAKKIFELGKRYLLK